MKIYKTSYYFQLLSSAHFSSSYNEYTKGLMSFKIILNTVRYPITTSSQVMLSRPSLSALHPIKNLVPLDKVEIKLSDSTSSLTESPTTHVNNRPFKILCSVIFPVKVMKSFKIVFIFFIEVSFFELVIRIVKIFYKKCKIFHNKG